MVASPVGLRWIEILIFLLSGGSQIGLPPGERDVALLNAVPQQSLVYIEWAGRGPGAPGIGVDGLFADPEIKAFFGALDKSLAAERSTDEDPNQVMSRNLRRWFNELTSRPGCLFVALQPPTPGNNNLLKAVNPLEIVDRLQIGLVSTSKADSPKVIDGFNRLAGTELSDQPRMESVMTSFSHSLTVHRDGDRVLFGFGTGVVERLLSGLNGAASGLNTNARFTAAWNQVASPRFCSALWLDLRSVKEASLNSLGPAGLLVQGVLRGCGADALDYMVSGTGVNGRDVVQRTFIGTGGRTDGILMLARNPAIQLGQIRHVPADSDLFAAVSFDVGAIVADVRDTLSKTAPLSVPVFDQVFKELEAELGLKLSTEVFPAFGNVWTAFNSPAEGGIGGTSLIVALEVRDQPKAELVFNKLIQIIEQSVANAADPEGFGFRSELKRYEFMDHSISCVERGSADFVRTPNFTPSFCLTRNHLLVSLHPQAIKAHLRFLASGQPGFDTVAARKLSLSNEPLLMTAFMDGRRAAQMITGIMPFVGQLLIDIAYGPGTEFDVFALPSAAALLPYANDVTVSMARQKDGVLIESKNPHIGGATLAFLIAAKSWAQSEYGEFQVNRTRPAAVGGLGNPEGAVVPAAAEAKATGEKPRENSADLVKRKVVPLVIRSFLPEEVQPLITEDLIKKLSQPPSPAVLQQREERKQRLADRRRERLERRHLPAPTGRIPPAGPPVPNPPPPAPRP